MQIAREKNRLTKQMYLNYNCFGFNLLPNFIITRVSLII